MLNINNNNISSNNNNNNFKKNNDQIKTTLNILDSKSKKMKTIKENNNSNSNNNKNQNQKVKEKDNQNNILKEKESPIKEIEIFINSKDLNKSKRDNFISKIPEYDGVEFIHLGKNSKRNFNSKL
jgi:hypothetical protein